MAAYTIITTDEEELVFDFVVESLSTKDKKQIVERIVREWIMAHQAKLDDRIEQVLFYTRDLSPNLYGYWIRRNRRAPSLPPAIQNDIAAKLESPSIKAWLQHTFTM